jgi:hypothetical protein
MDDVDVVDGMDRWGARKLVASTVFGVFVCWAAPAATEPSARDPRELTDVEQALGRDMDRQYRDYLATRDERHASFAWYLYDEGRDARESGELLAGLGAPLIFSIAAGAALAVGQPWKWKDCPEPDEDENNDSWCELAQFPLQAGFFVVSAMGVAGTALALIFGIRKYRRGKLFEERMRPLLGRKYSASDALPTWSLAPLVASRGPAGLSVAVEF